MNSALINNNAFMVFATAIIIITVGGGVGMIKGEILFEGVTSAPVTSRTFDYTVGSDATTATPFVANPPSTAAAASRQRLLTFLTHPSNRQQNIDLLPTHVMIKLLPIKIQDLNEKNEVLETTIRLQMTWRDTRLIWNPKAYYNVTELVVPGNQIWSPDIGILNSVSDIYHVVRDTRFEMKVESGGRVWWHPTGIVKTYCKLHLRYYPFDRQKCKLVLESPTLDVRFMNLTLRHVSEPVDTIMYMAGETWELVSVNGYNTVNKVGSKTKFTRVEFVIHIQRATIYHLLNVILPAIFLSLVQVMFFLLPATHPQRVGSSTTTLLSVVVFHSVAVSQLPKTSTDVPLLAAYIFMVTFVSGLSVCTSIFVAKFAVYADQRHEMPAWLLRIPHPFHQVGRMFSRQNNHHRRTAHSPQPVVAVATTSGDNDRQKNNRESKYDNAEDDRMLPSPPSTSAGASDKEARPNTPQERHNEAFLFNTWLDVSWHVDIALMLVAVLSAVLSPFITFVIVPTFANVDEELGV